MSIARPMSRAEVPRLGLRSSRLSRSQRGTLLRGFMYDFLQMLAPHLSPRLVQSAEKSESQEEVEKDFATIKIPFLR